MSFNPQRSEDLSLTYSDWGSTMVFIADTWLHFTTKTTIFTQVLPNTIPANHSYSLRPECTDNPTPYSGLSGCTLNPAAPVTFVMDGGTTLKVLNNVSETTMVRTVSGDGAEIAYLGNTPQPQLSAIDYTANTWAVESKCAPVTTKCMDDDQFFGAGTPFKCSFAFEGDLAGILPGPWQMAYFTNSSATDNFTQFDPVPNPYYFSIAAALNEQVGLVVGGPNENDPEFMIATHGALVFALFAMPPFMTLSTHRSTAPSVGLSTNPAIAPPRPSSGERSNSPT